MDDQPSAFSMAAAVMAGDHPADRRLEVRARLLNALVPGLGLVCQDRLLCGVALGLLFWLPLTGAVFLTWISPASTPAWCKPILWALEPLARRSSGFNSALESGGLASAYARVTLAAGGLLAIALSAYAAAQVVLGRTLARRAGRLTELARKTVPLLRSVYDAMGKSRWIEAQLNLDRVLELDPENFEANLLQARLLAAQHKDEQALRAYSRCRSLDAANRWRWEIDREVGIIRGR